jgi:predicted phosphohydrolase
MAIFAISDLHLALSVDKPMDVFGAKWANYMERLETNWREKITDEDTVIMPGDISWATYLEDAVADFRFIHSLPGQKIISKGNHDYWWTTANKLNGFLKDNGFTSIRFLHNNSFKAEGSVICGTRGWIMPEEGGLSPEDTKIFNRELQRLEQSLNSTTVGEGERLIVALHFPPCNSKGVFSDFLDIMQKYRTALCIYGHLHGPALAGAFEGFKDGVEFKLVSADHLRFEPLKLG